HGDGGGSHGSSGKGKGPRLHVVKEPGTKGPKESQPPINFEDRPTPIIEGPAKEQQLLDLSLIRMLRSRPMDEKDRQFKARADAAILGSANETRRRTLNQEVIAKLPVPRREELLRSLKNLPPDLVDVFGSAASDLPWQSMARAFVEMKLIRSSPGEISEPPPSGTSTRPWREALADELRSDHRRLFDAPLPGAAEQLNLAMNGLSEATVSLLGHWTHSAGTRLLMGQRLGLPGIPAEPAILEAYQRWLSRSPESE
ncbi:MAG TPA: hypothetical protein VJP40_09035, partial [bacterium]|nr:hypothetical protein [bacterium]